MTLTRRDAGGQLAVTASKGAAADGSNILLTPMSILGLYPYTYRKLPYDPIADLTPVSMGATSTTASASGRPSPRA